MLFSGVTATEVDGTMRVETVLLLFYSFFYLFPSQLIHQFSLFSILFLQHCHFVVFYLWWSYNVLNKHTVCIFTNLPPLNTLDVVSIGFYSDGLQNVQQMQNFQCLYSRYFQYWFHLSMAANNWIRIVVKNTRNSKANNWHECVSVCL